MTQRNNFTLMNVFENCKRPFSLVYKSCGGAWFGKLTTPANERRANQY